MNIDFNFGLDDNLSMLDFSPLTIDVDWTRFDIIINKLIEKNDKLKELLDYTRFMDVYYVEYGDIIILESLYEKNVFGTDYIQEYEYKVDDYDRLVMDCDGEFTFIVKDIADNYVLLHTSQYDSCNDIDIDCEHSNDPKHFWDFILTSELRKKIIENCEDAK